MNFERVMQQIQAAEGRINHMYKCTGGKVTVGCGHAIQHEAHLFGLTFRTASGAAATLEQCVDDFRAVAAASTGLKASAYKQHTRLHMVDTDIDALLRRDIDEFMAGLRVKFPEFDLWPEPAQEAVFDMAYNLGLAGLVQKFPNCCSAIRKRDWDAASRRCHRAGISEDRNRATAELFKRAITA